MREVPAFFPLGQHPQLMAPATEQAGVPGGELWLRRTECGADDSLKWCALRSEYLRLAPYRYQGVTAPTSAPLHSETRIGLGWAALSGVVFDLATLEYRPLRGVSLGAAT
jgi:hypothetical protein